MTRDIDITENRVADLGEGSWGPEHPPPPPLILVKKKKSQEEEKPQGKQNKTTPSPLSPGSAAGIDFEYMKILFYLFTELFCSFVCF